jgi:hypothetical protein
MASLTGSSVASSYKDLLQVSNSNSGIDGTARVVSDGEDTASKLFLDTNRVGVGIAPTEGTLHVHTATADGGGETATADGAADDLVVENSGAGGITILTPNNALGQLAFGSPADAYGAFIGWKSDDNQMTIATANAGDSIVLQTANKATALTIDSSQNATFAKGVTISNGNLDIAATKKLFFDAGGDTYIHEQASNKLDFFVGNGTRFVLDANSRISLSNNDGGGTGGNASTSANTLLGYGIADMDDGSISNTLIGHRVAGSGSHADMTGNTAVGNLALYYVSSADNNTALGSVALHAITSGNENTAVGSRALGTADTATFNVAVGGDAMFGIPTGQAVTGVVAVGLEACKGDSNTTDAINNTVAVGRSALKLLRTGGNCTAVGYQALEDNLNGYNNTAVGYQSLTNATGGGNSGLGSQAGDLIITGTNNTLLGSASEVSANNAVNQTVIGQGATGQADNSVVLGNGDVTAVYMAQDSGAKIFCGDILSGRSSAGDTGNGHSIRSGDSALFSRDASGETMQICRNASDGQLIQFKSNGNVVGDIRNDGGTVSLTGFSGGHESSSSDSLEIGMVVSTIDEEHSKNHAKVEKSKTVGDKRVYGVVSNLEGLNGNNVTVASVGISSIKVTGSCEGGDLLESNGDGTAKVQSDDIIRSKTIGKVTMGNSTEEVKLVSCVLYCG